MPQPRGEKSRERIVETASRMFRQHGYAGTSVDLICHAIGITKGAFFHHFASKEMLAKACLIQWDQMAAGMDVAAAAKAEHPYERVKAFFDVFFSVMSAPTMIKSCLAGTTLHEVSESSETLRAAANDCLVHHADRLKQRLDDACAVGNVTADTAALSRLWVAALQGALILYKGSRDEKVIPQTLGLVRQIILDAIKPRNV